MSSNISQTKYIRLHEALHILQVSEDGFEALLAHHEIKPQETRLGPSITREDLEVLASSPHLRPLFLSAIAAQAQGLLRDRESGRANAYLAQARFRLKRYRGYLDTIKAIHSNLDPILKPLMLQTPEAAAYILIAGAITLLEMSLVSLNARFLESTIYLRPIDEALALAEYFLITRTEPKGKSYLSQWFKFNYSPPHVVCRKRIDEWHQSIPGLPQAPSMESILSDLYSGKGKIIHAAHHSIMEHYFTIIHGTVVRPIGFVYGALRNPRKYFELVEFYQSSIWTLAQAMLVCFSVLHPILRSEEVEILQLLNRRFDNDLSRRRALGSR